MPKFQKIEIIRYGLSFRLARNLSVKEGFPIPNSRLDGAAKHRAQARFTCGNDSVKLFLRWLLKTYSLTTCRLSIRQFVLSGLVVELFLEFFLDHLPAFFGMGDDALGAVLEASGQDAETAGAGKEEERAVAEEAGLPVLQLVARQKLAFVVDEMFIVHLFSVLACQLAG